MIQKQTPEMMLRAQLQVLRDESDILELRAEKLRQHARRLEEYINMKWGRAPEVSEL